MAVVDIPTTGKAWPDLEAPVDQLVRDVMDEHALPGATVAVTRHGRLLLLKGYGYARLEPGNGPKVRMQPGSRIRGGSIGKPLVTGAATVQLLRSKGIDPTQVRLYGQTGLFKGRFDPDIEVGIKAHSAGAPNRRQWYRQITIQHLLDHAAGFSGASSTEEAAALFGIPEAEVTYDHVHRHFLRTQELAYEPGNPPPEVERYSNHGFGLLTLVVEQVAGTPYARYVQERYLRPLGLHHHVRPEWAHEDSCDAWNHARAGERDIETMPFAQWGLGLAAGGFRYTAEGLVRLMDHLARTYTVDELDHSGWGANEKGKLGHGGRVGGGTAYVAMYPRGYASDGRDLSRVHVGVLAPIKMSSSGTLRTLASRIALEVADAQPAEEFDLWRADRSHDDCELVRLAVPAAQYQELFDETVRAGYRLDWIDGFTQAGQARFNVIFRSDPETAEWASHHHMTGADYQKRFERFGDAGFTLAHVDSYVVAGGVRYAAVWTKGGQPVKAYHGRSAAEHQALFDDLTAAGWLPRAVSPVSLAGALSYTALYDRHDAGAFELRSRLRASDYQARSDANLAAGRQLRYLKGYVHDGKPHFSAIWASEPELSRYEARHGMTPGACVEFRREANAAGSRTRLVTAHPDGGAVRFAGCWGR